MKKVRLRSGLGSDFNPSKHGQRTPLLTAHLRLAGPSRPDGSFQNTHSCSLPEKSIRFIHEEQKAEGEGRMRSGEGRPAEHAPAELRFRNPMRLRPQQWLGTPGLTGARPVLQGSDWLVPDTLTWHKYWGRQLPIFHGLKLRSTKRLLCRARAAGLLSGWVSPSDSRPQSIPALCTTRDRLQGKSLTTPTADPLPAGAPGLPGNQARQAHAHAGPSQRGPAHPRRLVLAQSKTLCMAVTPSRPMGATSPPVMMA